MALRAVVAAFAAAGVLAGCSSAAIDDTAHRSPAREAGQNVPASTSARWQISFRTTGTYATLDGLASISAQDAWVIGLPGRAHAGPIVLNWNGSSWRSVRLPAGPGFVPQQVMASAADNVWILGLNRTGGRTELFRFDGSSWRAVPMPPGQWGSNLSEVVGPAGAWLAGGGCQSRSWPWNCSSTLAQWTGTRWITYHLPILVTGLAAGLGPLAAVGGHTWVLGVTGIRPKTKNGHPADGIGRLVIYQQSASGWQQVMAPVAAVGGTNASGNPQITAGPAGRAWILLPARATGKQQGTLYYWNGESWTKIAIPVRVAGRPLSTGTQLSFDGSRGIWAGPAAHWTGRAWVSVAGFDGNPTAYLYQEAGIPGTPSSWAIGSAHPGAGPGVIAVNGPLPAG